MKINENEIVKEAICVFNGYLRIEYDRNDDKILFKPCCEAVPKSLDQLRIDSNYFINNVEKCIHDFENLNLRVLTKYYTGNCYITEQHSGINNLCENYLFNKKINWIENSILTGCNLNCIMCGSDHSYHKKEVDLYKRLTSILKTYDLKFYNSTCQGEPLLYKDNLFDFIEHSKCNVNILSNGLLLNNNDIEFLSKYKNRVFITISIDSHIKETYERIRLGSNYDTVMNNIFKLQENGLLSRIHYVVQEENKNEAEDALKFFKANNIKVSVLSDGYIGKYNVNLKQLCQQYAFK